MITPAASMPLALALLGTIVLGGCSQPTAEAVAQPVVSASASATPPSPSTTTPPGVAPAPSRTPGWTPSPVSRPGALPAPERIKAPAVTYRKPVTYPDGLTVSVTAIKQQTVTQVGPGAITGAPMTTFTVRFTNGTTASVDLNQVVVSAYYGASQTAAAPVYEGSLNDFSGQLVAGASKAADYAFSIPVKDLGSATLAIDFDGRHTVAVFTGSAH